jgi:hypothetical protein
MPGHLKPVEFIDAVERKSRGARAAAHLEQCGSCRETLADLRYSLRIFQPMDDREIPSDAAFWSEFTQRVHRVVAQQPSRSGRIGVALAASLALALSSAMLFLISPRGLPRGTARAPVDGQSGAPQVALLGSAPSAEVFDESVGFERLDVEQYLDTKPEFYDRLQRDLSWLRLGPESWTDEESGLNLSFSLNHLD